LLLVAQVGETFVF